MKFSEGEKKKEKQKNPNRITLRGKKKPDSSENSRCATSSCFGRKAKEHDETQ